VCLFYNDVSDATFTSSTALAQEDNLLKACVMPDPASRQDQNRCPLVPEANGGGTAG
jgi:hypothetical protein